MQCGISTACFYPADTIDSLERVAALGAAVTEVFLNSPSEVDEPYLSRLVRARERAGIRVASVHPYGTVMDDYFFSSTYPSRLADGIAVYRRQFAACQALGADKLVFHGSYKQPRIQRVKPFPVERYAEHFCVLSAVAAEYGVALCQENVAYCMMATVEDARQLGPLYGNHAAYVLDTKQAWRRGEDPAGFLPVMAGRLRQVHLSDSAPGQECLLPGRGSFDIPGFIQQLLAAGYTDDIVIEVYSDCFGSDDELAVAMDRVNAAIQAACG